MRARRRSWSIPFLLGVFSVALVTPVVARGEATPLKDVTGTELPRGTGARMRIVALAPSLAELAADFLGADLHRLVGVSEFSDFPAALKKVTSVGPFHQVDLEKIVELKPDLVLATLDGNSRDQVMRLREMRVPVVVVATSTLAQIASSMELVGTAVTGEADKGRAMAEQFKKGIESLREQARTMVGGGTRVLIQVGEDPLVVAGAGSFLHEALETAGFRNAYRDLSGAWPRPSLEDAVARNPDAILVLTMGQEAKWARRSAELWNQRKKMDAVRNGRVFVMNGDLILRPTLRLLEGLSLLQKRLGSRAGS